MIPKKLRTFLMLGCLLSGFILSAQPIERLVKIVVAPDHANWVYRSGEKANFQVTVLKNSEPVPNAKIKYEFGPEQMVPTKRDSAVLKDG